MKITRQLITNKTQLGGIRPLSAIKFIVIHDTANDKRGADADAHYRNLQRLNSRVGSAHYYVDDEQIVQTIDDSVVAWCLP
jgi:N-acetylmuramoyl-L-alanine amidase CwlA